MFNVRDHFFFSQPHQPFFVLAFVNAIVGMILFTPVFHGKLHSFLSSADYHAYTMIFLLFTPAFLAFLFTTFSRFSATQPIPKRHYMEVLTLFLIGSLLFHIGTFTAQWVAVIGMVLVLLGHLSAGNILLSIYNISTMPDKFDQKWILIGVGLGLIAHLLFIIAIWVPLLHALAIGTAIYLYLFLITFTIAQRMVPFFSHTPIQKHTKRFYIMVGLLAVHTLLEAIASNSSFLVDLILAYLLAGELYRWRLPFPNENPLVWILHIALFWVPVSFLISSFSSLTALVFKTNLLYLDIHVLLLGFLLTILIGFGTRVTLGHSGSTMRADRWAILLFYWTQVVVVMRILTSVALVMGWNFFIFFDISVAAWLLLFGVWASRFFRILVFGKQPESGK